MLEHSMYVYGAPHIDAIVTFLQQPRELMPMQLLRPCNRLRNSSRATIYAAKIGIGNSGKELASTIFIARLWFCYTNHLNH